MPGLSEQYLAERSVDIEALDIKERLAAARNRDQQAAYSTYMEGVKDQFPELASGGTTKEEPTEEPETEKGPEFTKAMKIWGSRLPRNITAGVIDGSTETLDLLLGDAKAGADQWIAESFPEYADAVKKFRGWMDPQGAGDEVVQEMARFAVPFTGYLKAFGAASHTATKAKKFADVVGADIVANLANMDPHMERFAGLLQMLGIENDFISYIADTENETEAEGRLKNAIDSVGIAAPVMGTVFGSAKAMKSLWHNGPAMAERIKNYQMVEPGSREAQKGAIAFHGSPHKFEEFDMSKIGTGEGAQAYGHGLYFAESPGVAKSYQKSTARYSMWDDDIPASVIYKGESYSLKKSFKDSTPQEIAIQSIGGDNRGSPSRTLEDLSGWLDEDIPLDQKEKYKQAIAWLKEEIDSGDKAIYEIEPNRGALYEVDIPDESIDKMLDWDAPLSEQAWLTKGKADDIIAKVKAEGREPTIAEKAAVNLQKGGYADKRGEVFYKDLAHKLGSEKAASEALAKEGISGIKYLDLQSRNIPDMNATQIKQLNKSINKAEKDIADIKAGDLDEALEAYKESTVDKSQAKELRASYLKKKESRIAELQKMVDEAKSKISDLEKNEGVTRNIVIFDEKLVTVKSTNGKPVAKKKVAKKRVAKKKVAKKAAEVKK